MAALDMSASWWLKAKLAEQHLSTIKEYIEEAKGPSPRAIRVEKRYDGARWDYFAWHDLALDPILAAVIGEFLYDLRSALDHVVAANVPESRRSFSQFPIFLEDIWAKKPDGNYVEEYGSKRRDWKDWTKGAPEAVMAVIREAQPYNQALKQGNNASDHALAILHDLQVADKHRQLSIVDAGIEDPRGVVVNPDGTRIEIDYRNAAPGQIAPDGAHVFESDSEVDVQLTGTLKVAMARGPKPTDPEVRKSIPHREIPVSLEQIFTAVGDTLALVHGAM